MELQPQIDEAKHLLQQGDYFGVYDAVQKQLEDGVVDAQLIHLALIALARSGATRQALALYEAHRSRLPESEQFVSLLARLYKDLFHNCSEPERKNTLGRHALDLYRSAHTLAGTYYPLINAATLSFLIGDTELAAQLAQQVLKLCGKEKEQEGLEGYYLKATQAEACLLLGRDDETQQHLEAARNFCPWDLGNLSTTYQQLRLICKKRGVSRDLLEAIRPPTVITYTGQMIHGIGKTPGIDPADEGRIREQIDALLEKHRVRVAYGSLASGADILVAEAVLEAGGELNIVLPFGAAEFKHISVAPAGPEWVDRFDAVMNRAASVSLIVEEAITGYDLLFEVCSRQCMGLAHLRSKTLGSRAYQIAVWNQLNADNPAGTAGAMRRWLELGMENLVVPVPPPKSEGVSASITLPPAPAVLKRQMKAMIFADVKGYSGLSERQLAGFISLWVGALERIHEENREHIHYINTWGDAAYLVIDRVSFAAKIALEMAGMFNGYNFSQLGLPPDMGLRVAAHVGPIFETDNPVLGKPDFFGMHVNQTARLEPCTPPGSVYVTEPFAALISMENDRSIRCEYVGRHPLPKGFGRIRMYHLRKL